MDKRTTDHALAIEENRSWGGVSAPVELGASPAEAAAVPPSFRTKRWVRVVSAVMAVLLAVTMFDTTSLSPLITDAQAAPASPSAALPLGERALYGESDNSPEPAGDDADAADSSDAPKADEAAEVDETDGADEAAPSAWDAARKQLAASDLADLAPEGLTAADEVLPSAAGDFSDPDDIASRISPALVAWGAPLNSTVGYQLQDRKLRVRYDLGNLGLTLAGGHIGGSDANDPVVLTLELPYLYQAGEAVGATLSEEEWRAQTALARLEASDPDTADDATALIERALASLPDDEAQLKAPRVALFADDVPAQWSVWQEHAGAYRKISQEDLQAGVSGHVVLRYEGVDGNLQLAADALAPSFTLGFAGSVPQDASAAVRFGYEFHSYTSPAVNPATGEPDVSTARVLRSAIGSITVANSAGTTGATLDARTVGALQMPQMDGRGRGWNKTLAAFTVPADSEPASSFMLTAAWPADWQGKGGVPLSELAAYRLPADGEEAPEGWVANQDDEGAVITDVDALADCEFVGVPGMGGAVVLDVTGLTSEQLASIDPADAATLEALDLAPLSYTVMPDGTISVRCEGDAGVIEPGSTRKLYVAVPYDEDALVVESGPTDEDPQAPVTYAEVRADLRLQVLAEEEGASVYHANVVNLKSRFVPVSESADVVPPAGPDDSEGDGKGESGGDGDGDDDGDDSDGADEGTEADNAGAQDATADNAAGLAPAMRLFADMPLYATARSNVSPDTVINPHPLLLSENELVPGADTSKGELAYLVKSTDLTRMNLNMTFGFQQGWVGSMLQKTSFKVTSPYL